MSEGEIWGSWTVRGTRPFFGCVSAMLDYKWLGFMDGWGQGHPEKAHVSGLFGKTREVFLLIILGFLCLTPWVPGL